MSPTSRPRDHVTEVAGELQRTQQEETVAVGQRGVLTGGVEKVKGHWVHARITTPFAGRHLDVAHSRTNDDAVKCTQRRNHGRADLSGGAGHEDAIHQTVTIR